MRIWIKADPGRWRGAAVSSSPWPWPRFTRCLPRARGLLVALPSELRATGQPSDAALPRRAGPLAPALGFAPMPPALLAALGALVVPYLAAAEVLKRVASRRA